MGAGQQGVVWAVRPGVVGGVAARLRLRSELRPSLRLRRPATPLAYRCQGDISKSVNRVTFLLRYNTQRRQIPIQMGGQIWGEGALSRDNARAKATRLK